MVPCLFPTTGSDIPVWGFPFLVDVHARIDEEWSCTRASFIKAVTCGRDMCMQVLMQTDPYINTTRCVGIAAAPTHLCVITQRPTDLGVITQRPTDLAVAGISLLFRETHVSAWEVGYLEAFLSRRWDTTASSLINITSSFLIFMCDIPVVCKHHQQSGTTTRSRSRPPYYT
jgi:hypothetical protein